MTETQSRDDAAYATVRHAIGRPGMLLVTVMVVPALVIGGLSAWHAELSARAMAAIIDGCGGN